MSKQVIIRFVGADPTFTTPKLFVNGQKHDYIYCDRDYALALTAAETTVFVRVYGYQSNTIKLRLEDEIALLKVAYHTNDNDVDDHLSDYDENIALSFIGMLVRFLNSIPSIGKSTRKDMVSIECFRHKIQP